MLRSYEIENAMRGQQRVSSLAIFNDENETLEFAIKPGGDIDKTWIKLANDSGATISLVKIAAKKRRGVRLTINIPPGAANGAYEGWLDITPINAKHKKGSQFILVPRILVNISVTDKEIINIEMPIFDINDQEVGQQLQINVGLQNHSNVDVSPTLRIRFMKNSMKVKESVLEIPSLMIDLLVTQNYSLDFGNMKAGKYVAIGTFEFHGVKSPEVKRDFSIVPRGTFSKGKLLNLKVTGKTNVGKSVKIDSTYLSESPRDNNVQFLADVYFNDLKIGSLESKIMTVKSHSEASFSVPFKINKAGPYAIDGYFKVGDKETNHKKIAFTARSNFIPYGIAVAIIIISSLTIVMLIKSGRKKKASRASASDQSRRLRNR